MNNERLAGLAAGLMSVAGISGLASAQAPTDIPNPYEGAHMFVSPDFRAHIQDTRAAVPAIADLIAPLESMPTAFWMSSIADIATLEPALVAAEAEASSKGPVVVTIVVYDLPDRDCAAIASAGELKIDERGLERYRNEFIDPIADVLRAHTGVRVAVVLEPDSLPNLATNLNVPKCARAATTYLAGVVYALQALSQPHVSIYLDAAHAGWLGWEAGRRRAAEVFRDVLQQAGPGIRHRGFAINTANYTPTHAPSPDPLGEDYYDWNPARDEATYAVLLAQELASVGVAHRDIVIDTSRNGNPLARSDSANWCNVRDAGLGERPRVAPLAGVDAFLWVKPPGESDGSTVDPACTSVDSALNPPAAGEWFLDHFTSMARRASPAL